LPLVNKAARSTWENAMKWTRLLNLSNGALALALMLPTAAVAAGDVQERVAAAVETINSLTAAPDKGIPMDLIKDAQCIIVVPSLKSAALGIGGEYGRGFASCRVADGWSAPAAIKVEGGSFGFQIGGAETEVVMLVMNKKGMENLLNTKFTLGGEVKVAAGPIGRSGAAKTDAGMRAEILSYSRARGVFAGVALNGATLREDQSANEDLYGKEVSNRTILAGGVPASAKAQPFLHAIRPF
jgi:lipid-binding SYLF domain-containing protein